jgi:hypothetical protein
MQAPVTRLDDCQYLLVRQIPSTLTHCADHGTPCSHDAINRSVRGEQVTPRLVWEHVRAQGMLTPDGDVLFDDTVLDKHSACAIECVRHPYSGNATQVSKGSGGVPWVDVNPALALCGRIADRLSAPEGDGKSKRDHVRERLTHVVSHTPLPLQAVWMDTGYATQDRLLCIEWCHKVSSCPRKDNRQVDDSSGQQPSQRVAV